MRILISLFFVFLMGCEYTATEKRVCGNRLNDISGFAGRYSWNLGDGQQVPVQVKKSSKGRYSLRMNNKEAFEYTTCVIAGKNIAEQFVESDDGSPGFYMLLTVKPSNGGTTIKTLQFDEKTLRDNEISYDLESDVIEGIPVSVILLKNRGISQRDLVKLSVENNGREPYIIELTK